MGIPTAFEKKKNFFFFFFALLYRYFPLTNVSNNASVRVPNSHERCVIVAVGFLPVDVFH